MLLYVDRRESSTNATTEIVTVRLGGDDIQGEHWVGIKENFTFFII